MSTKAKYALYSAAKKLFDTTRGLVDPILPGYNTHCDVSDWDYNCWAFTALAAGWMDEHRWLDDYEMESFLGKHAKMLVSSFDVQVGDIAIFRDPNYGTLLHTALIIDPKTLQILHKDGSCPIEINYAGNVYRDAEVTFARIAKGKTNGSNL